MGVGAIAVEDGVDPALLAGLSETEGDEDEGVGREVTFAVFVRGVLAERLKVNADCLSMRFSF